MIPVLPTVNAALNATAAVLLVRAYRLIRRKRIEAHRKTMLSAFAVSCLFLVCYLVYHAQVGSVRFQKTGAIRTVYLGILSPTRCWRRRCRCWRSSRCGGAWRRGTTSTGASRAGPSRSGCM